jgi:uncharacterized protein YbjT (DUF2867 family)
VRTVVVHGASGTQGAPVARRLAAAGHRVRCVGRRALAVPGALAVAADLGDTRALAAAYAGADAVVVHLPGPAVPEADAVAQADAVLAALARAAVPRAVFVAAGAVWDDDVGVPFLDARRRLADGLTDVVPHATVVVPATAYLENLAEPWVVARLRATGELVQPAPGDAPVPWLALDDVAALVADVLDDPGPPGRAAIVGPEAVPGHAVAATLSGVLAAPVRWTTVPFAEYADLLAPHLGRRYADGLAALYGPDSRVPPPPAPAVPVRRGATTVPAWVSRRDWTPTE